MAGETNAPIPIDTPTITAAVSTAKNLGVVQAWTNCAFYAILLLADIRDALYQRQR